MEKLLKFYKNELSLLFTIRYTNGITSKMRIKFGTRLFNIRAVVNIDEKNELLELTAEEFVSI